ncbi:NlpC/P60 family protein [Paenibacillus sp. NPDC057886]|uniref:NlpC/P60 family protein n=1 Tax=Paenibacillus sp. NPDC057886 TaxID=3346270 RepID=UPI00367DB815
MQNFPIAISATEAAMNSQGSAVRENEKYMQSLEARIQKMKTAWETLSIAFGEAVISDTIITLTSLFAGMLNGVAVLVDKTGALPVVLGAIGIGIAILRPKLAALIWDLTKTNITLLATSPAAAAASLGMKTLAGAMNIARGAVTALKFALKALLASTIIGGAFVLLGSALEWIVGKFSDATTATEDFSDKTEELNQKQYDLSNLKSLSKEYDELSKKTELSFEEKSRLAQIESELSSKYNVTTTSVDGQTKSYEENNKAIQTQIGLREDELKAARLVAELEYNSNAEKIDNDIEKEKKALIEREKAYDAALAAYEANKVEWAKVDPSDSYANMLAESANKQLAQALKEESALLSESKTSFQTTLNAKALSYKEAGQSFVDEQEANSVKIKGLTRGFLDIYANAAAESGVSANQFKKNLSDVFRSIQGKDLASAEEGMKLLKDMPGVLNLTSTSYKDMMSILSQYTYAPVVEGVESVDDALNSFNLTMEETVERTDEMSQKISETATFVSETKKEIDVLNTAQSELAKGNRLSTETIKKMNDKYGDFIKVTGLSKEAIKKYVAAKKEERISIVNDEIAKTKTTIDETKKRIAAYEIEMAAWERRRKVEASAKIKEINSQLEAGLITEQQAEQMFGVYRRNQSGIDSNGNIINNSTISDYAMERAALKDLLTDLSLLESARSDLTTAANDSSKATKDATKTNKDNADSVKEVIDVETEWQKKMRESQRLLEKINNERYKFKKSSAEYRQSLMDENKERQKQIDLSKEGLNNPSQLVSSKVTTTTTTGTSDKSSSSSSSIPSSGSSTKLDTMLSNALGLQGKFTYKQITGKFDGTFDQFKKRALSDCSQFVQEMFDEFLGINLPRTAAEQSKQGTAVDKKDLKKGDLVFFETIKGKQASHVGIYTGNGKFVQMGDSGLKEQDINNSYWGPKYRSARRINGVGSSTVDSIATNGGKTTITQKSGNVTTKTEASSASDIANAKQREEDNISSQQREMYANRIEFIESLSAVYEEAAEIIDDKISKSQSKQSTYGESSADWRKEEMSQISYLEQKNKKLAEQRVMLEKEVKNKQITSGEFDRLMAQNEVEQAQIESEIASKRNNVYESQRKAYEEQAKADDNAISLSESKLKLMTEGSVEYNKELRSQLPILEHKQTVTKGEIEYTERLLKSGKLNAVQTEDYTNKLKELNLQLLETNSALKDVNDRLKDLKESAADNIIDEYKKVIEQQRDLALDAIDQEREKEDKRHEERTKNIDKEQKQFENYINARLKAFDRENANVDYTEELKKKMDERQKIQDRLNTLSADNSMEGKAKRKELQDQLTTIDEEIRKFQRDRDRELVKQGLQDQLDDHKDYNDKLKDEEDKLHEDTLKKLDKEKKETERKYKDILEDQKKFYELKKGLMSNDAIVVTATLGIISGEYDKLFGTINKHVFETSKEMQNMVYDFQKSMESLNKYSGGDYSAPDSGSSNGSNGGTSGSTGTIKGTTAARVAWTEYLSNKQSAESIKAEMAKLDKSSTQYKNLTQQFDTLKSKNDQLRSVYGFPDGSFKDLVSQKIFSAETGGMTPAGIGKDGKFLLAHEKELILNKSDTSNLLKTVDVVRGITDKIKSGLDFSGLFSKATPTPSTNDNRIQIEKVEIHAKDTDTGQSLSDKFFGAVNKQLKTRTI